MTTRILGSVAVDLAEALGRLPDVHRVPVGRTHAARSVEGLIAYLDAYSTYVADLRAKEEARRQLDQRAAVILRGLRASLDNAASVLAELDAAEETDR